MDIHTLNTLLSTFTIANVSDKTSNLGQVAIDIDLALPGYLMEMRDGENCATEIQSLFEDVVSRLEQELRLLISPTLLEKLYIGELVSYLQLTVTLINFYSETNFQIWFVSKETVHRLFKLCLSI